MLGAVASALASALINPEAVRGVYRALFASETAATDPTQSPAPPEHKEVVDRSGALALLIPADWGAADSSFQDADDETPLGPGLIAAPDPALPRTTWREPRVFFGASRSLVEQLELGSNTERAREVLTDYARTWDWTLDNCTLETESVYERGFYWGIVRRWKGCGHLPVHFWEMWVLDEDLQFVAVLQVQFPEAAGVDAAQPIFEGFRVSPDGLNGELTGDSALP